MQFFLRKICSFPRKTRKPFQAPRSILQAENRVEIHYDSLDLRFKTTALEKKLVAKIVSIISRWPKYKIFLALQQSQ